MKPFDETIINQTLNWVRSFVIKLNICPFAKREVERNTLKIKVASVTKVKLAMEELLMELIFLDEHLTTETTLLVFPCLFKDFFQYLDFVDLAELLIQEQGYEGIYQLATFHPDYCFADTEFDDVTNYTNRSPYPMLHILREKSLEKAISYYGNTEAIPENNIMTMKRLGIKGIKNILADL